ncbi:MAG: L-fuculose-phosphate aldolase [Pararhizobium sp.]
MEGGTVPEEALRRQIIAACLQMNALGINQGTSGNISLRHGDGLLITPTAIPYEEMQVDDIVRLGLDGSTEGRQAPSSEWRFHRDIMMTRPDVGAIVHAHPPYATTIAIMERDIPAIHYMVAAAGGATIRCAPYATFGTEELSRHAVAALEGRKACLLAHHGMIAAGRSLAKAMWLAVEVEALARQYHGCLQIGEPPVLPDDEIERVLAKMEGYGRKD